MTQSYSAQSWLPKVGLQGIHRSPYIVFIIAFVTYAPSLFSEFIRDDPWQIVKNPQIQSWDYLPRLLSTHLWSQPGYEYAVRFYRPLFSFWMLVVNTIGGLSP